jgi:hypothetical protein
LEERFGSPKLESFSQRIVVRCYLESYHREETQAYIHAALAAAGREGEDVISSEACHAVYQATDGVPRLVNQVCDYALLLACAAGRQPIDRAVIEEAWADLQQLPTPWNGDSDEATPEGGIIEFGGLDDEPESIGCEAVDLEPAGEDEAVGDEPDVLPALRISPESEESVAPIEQVERIEQTLSDLEEEFQPAGSIGPELELVLDDQEDPFNEKFDEEEVIAGRCMPQAAGCEEEASSEEEEAEPIRDEGLKAEEHPEPSQRQPALSDEEESLPQWNDAVDDYQAAPATERAPQTIAAEMEPQEDRPGWRDDAGTVPMQRRHPVETVEAQQAVEADEKMIIVEESYDDTEPVHARPRPIVRRQEYGQLFANLRRGR